jgi:TRAP-type C4-dicarboxylate transport system permease small subunit
MKLLGKAITVFDRILDLLASLGCSILVFIMLSVSVDVVLRYFLNRPVLGLSEITGYLLLYMTFLGAAWLLRREGHVKVDIVLNRLGPRAQAALGITSSVIGIIISLALIWYGTETTWDHLLRGVYRTTILEFPKAPLLAVIPIGGFLLLIQFLRRARGYLESWRTPLNGEQVS